MKTWGMVYCSVKRSLANCRRIVYSCMIAFILMTASVPSVRAQSEEVATISGNVVNAYNQGISGIYIYANEYDTDGQGGWAITDETGSYTISLALGDYRVRICPTCLDASLPYANLYVGDSGVTTSWDLAKKFTLSAAGQSITQDFTLQPGGSISGTVRNISGASIPGLTVAVVDDQGVWIDSGSTDENGNYTITGLPITNNAFVYACTSDCDPTSSYISIYYDATAPVYFLEDANPISIQAGRVSSGIDFSLEIGNTVRGFVTNVSNPAEPLSGITVAAIKWGTDTWYRWVDTADDGSYSLSGLLDGNYRIQACAECVNQNYISRFYDNTPDYDSASPVILSGGQTLFDINFTLEPASLISGKITDQNNVALANIRVHAESAEDDQGFDTVTDNDGNYSIRVKPGFYRLFALPNPDSGFVHEIYDSSPNIEYAKIIDTHVIGIYPDFNFELEPSGTLTGIVKSDSGLPLASASVMAVLVDGSSRSYASEETGMDGVYTLEDLPAGNYILRATHTGSKAQFYDGNSDWTLANQVTISAGNITSGIDFSLQDEPGEDPNVDTVRQAMMLPGGYDPSFSQYLEEANIIDQIFAGLTRINPEDGKTIDNLISSTSPSSDSKVWSFVLRNGLKWSDGSPLTAEDLRYGILRGLRLDKTQAVLYNMFIIEGAEGYNQGKISPENVGITVTDDTHISFTLAKPNAFFPTILATTAARPLPRVLAQAYPYNWLNPDKLITSGPYQLVQYDQNNNAFLKKNSYFIDHDNVKIQQVYIQNATASDAWALFNSGKLDTAIIPTSMIPVVKADPILTNQLVQVKQQCTNFMGFNTDLLGAYQPNNPTKLRQALIEAVDRDQYNVVSMSNLPTAWTFIAPGILGHLDQEANIYLPYDPIQARSDISVAYDGNYHGLPPITLYYQTDSANPDSLRAGMQYLADTWNQTFDAEFTVEGITAAQYTDKLINHQLPIWRRGWCSDYQDGYNFLSSLLSMRDMYGTWDTAAYEMSLDQALSTLDETSRVDLYHLIEEKILKTDAMLMPLNYTISPILTRGFVRSYGVGGAEYFADWDFDRSDSMTIENTTAQTNMVQAAAGTTFTPVGAMGTISYEIPENVVPAGTVITHTGHLTYNLVSLPVGLHNTSIYFTIQAEDLAREPVSTAAEYTLTIQYSQEETDTNHLRESSLALYYWDRVNQQWVKDAKSVVNPTSNRIITHTRYLGDWAVLSEEGQDYYLFLPTVANKEIN